MTGSCVRAGRSERFTPPKETTSSLSKMKTPLCVLLLLAVVAVGFGGHSSTRPDRVVESGYLSPDGKWSLAYTRKNGYGHLDITQRATARTFRMYRSNDSCCAQITWLRPHLVIFVDDYRTLTLDPTTRNATQIAGFSNFVVSRDGRWVAGWADSGGHRAESVEVVPTRGGQCRQVPRRPTQDDNAVRFSPDNRSVTIRRRFFDVKIGEPSQNGFPSRWHPVTLLLSRLRPVATC